MSTYDCGTVTVKGHGNLFKILLRGSDTKAVEENGI
jgi:hypothetical protein